MIIGFMGELGSGKTLGSVIFAYYLWLLSDKKLTIWANFNLKNAKKIKSIYQLKKLNNAILVLDELHTLIDSRLWKYNKEIMDFFLQLRKYNDFLIFTTQHIKQVDVRLRNITQYLFYCERFENYFRYTLIDTLYKDIKKTLYLPKEEAKYFYDLYNTFEKVYRIPKKIKKKNNDNIEVLGEDFIFSG
jgi:hypothetical protein